MTGRFHEDKGNLGRRYRPKFPSLPITYAVILMKEESVLEPSITVKAFFR